MIFSSHTYLYKILNCYVWLPNCTYNNFHTTQDTFRRNVDIRRTSASRIMWCQDKGRCLGLRPLHKRTIINLTVMWTFNIEGFRICHFLEWPWTCDHRYRAKQTAASSFSFPQTSETHGLLSELLVCGLSCLELVLKSEELSTHETKYILANSMALHAAHNIPMTLTRACTTYARHSRNYCSCQSCHCLGVKWGPHSGHNGSFGRNWGSTRCFFMVLNCAKPDACSSFTMLWATLSQVEQNHCDTPRNALQSILPNRWLVKASHRKE